MALTDTAIKKLKPSAKCIETKQPDKYSDMNGLQLWVRYTGVKSWVIAYRFNKKQVNESIGQYPHISLAQARAKNLEIKSQLAQGIDPKEHAKQAKAVQIDTCFDVFAQKWLEYHETRHLTI